MFMKAVTRANTFYYKKCIIIIISLLLRPKAACPKRDKVSPQCRTFINVYIFQFFFTSKSDMFNVASPCKNWLPVKCALSENFACANVHSCKKQIIHKSIHKYDNRLNTIKFYFFQLSKIKSSCV